MYLIKVNLYRIYRKKNSHLNLCIWQQQKLERRENISQGNKNDKMTIEPLREFSEKIL